MLSRGLDLQEKKSNRLKPKEINWLTGKNVLSIYRKPIIDLPSGNQIEM